MLRSVSTQVISKVEVSRSMILIYLKFIKDRAHRIDLDLDLDRSVLLQLSAHFTVKL